jgi:hypothetical protein
MNLRVRRIDEARDFMALAPLWSRLTNDGKQPSPFLSYDWFWCCWHGVWPRCRPEILVIEEGETLVAIIPLMRWKERLHGLPVRCVGFLEYPNTPMADLLTIAEHSLVIEMLLDHLASRSDWDMVCLQKLSKSSPTLKALEGILPGRFAWHCAGDLFPPYLIIEGAWKSFYDALRPSVRSHYEKIQEELDCAGELRLEEHHVVDPSGPFFQEAIDLLYQGSQREWGVANGMVPRLPEFCSELTRRASKNAWLSLWLLRLNGHVIAMEYQLQADGKVQVLWVADDPEYRQFLPGSVLQLAALQALFERGCIHEYSLGPGVKEARLPWHTGTHEMVHLKFYRPGLYPRLLYRLETAVLLRAQK